MNPKRKPAIDETKMGKNPFVFNNVIYARTFDKTTDLLIHQTEEINLPAGKIKNAVLVEENPYTKVFHDTAYRKFILGLSEKALRLYTYITFTLHPGRDYIWLNDLHYKAETGYNKRKFTDGLNELIRYGILCPTIYTGVFFVNPFILFCGNRLKKYPDHIKLR